MLIVALFVALCKVAPATTASRPLFYTCGVDVCNEEKYCDATTRRCEWCVNKQQDCFTERHIANCTKFCRGKYNQVQENKLMQIINSLTIFLRLRLLNKLFS